MGIETGLYPVKHQAFITRRLPNLGINGQPLDMLIDRRKYKGFTAVYGQQLGETGQIIGCASPQVEPMETYKNLKINSKNSSKLYQRYLSTGSPSFRRWVSRRYGLNYYVEPRMILDPDLGLFVGFRGQGFMLSQYLAKIYVDKLMGKEVPSYFDRLKLSGDGLLEKAFK
ncbi:MAG: hypothetical protein U0Z17_01335 [Bacteroidales bacterium]